MSRKIEADKKKLIEQLKKMPIVQVACKQIGIPRSTFYRWRKEDADFAAECDVSLEQSAGMINDMAESQLINAIKNQNMTAIIFWLKHHHKAYETRLNVQGNIELTPKPLSEEQKKMIEQALQLTGINALSEGEDSDQ